MTAVEAFRVLRDLPRAEMKTIETKANAGDD
jgi:hypothetical protein